jgi:hypothetical protein
MPYLHSCSGSNARVADAIPMQTGPVWESEHERNRRSSNGNAGGSFDIAPRSRGTPWNPVIKRELRRTMLLYWRRSALE